MRVTIFGSGYVGLVTGACLADAGNHVICVDVDAAKIERLYAVTGLYLSAATAGSTSLSSAPSVFPGRSSTASRRASRREWRGR